MDTDIIKKPVIPSAQAIAELAKGLPPALTAGDTANQDIPRVIWQFWHKGLDGAPGLVKRSAETWRVMNPNHELRFLSLSDLNETLGLDISDHFDSMSVKLGWAGKSDLIRLLLLTRFGGIWADATTFCLNPLDDWMHGKAGQQGFFCFRKNDPGRNHRLVSWFMAAAPNHPLVRDVLDRSLGYLFSKRDAPLRMLKEAETPVPYQEFAGAVFLERCAKQGGAPYFWMFHLFNETAKQFPNMWQQVTDQTNARLQHVDWPLGLLTSHVSKQDYKGGYVKTENYQKRLNLLFSDNTVRDDFAKRRAEFAQPGAWARRLPNAQISEERKLIFVHIPKCGGTSVDNSIVFQEGARRHSHARFQDFEVLLGDRIKEFRCFTLARNPWDRLGSAFHFLTAGGAHRADKQDGERLLSKFDGDFGRFLRNFCANPRPYLRQQHFRPMVRYVDPRTCQIPLFIQRLEETKDLNPLRDYLKLPEFELPHHRKGSSPQNQSSAFTPELFEKVRKIYAADVKSFGYKDYTPDMVRY